MCAEAMKALIGSNSNGSNLPRKIAVELMSGNVIQCNLPPPKSHFTHVNVLGADALNHADMTTKGKVGKFWLNWE